MHIHLLAIYSWIEVSLGRYRCDYVDLLSMPLDVKVLFGNLSLVSAPAFSSRTKALPDGRLFTWLPSQRF